jgi:uroporphyrinogen decarboxylase
MYEEFVLPITQDFMAWAAKQGVRDVPLIIGGNTTPIAEVLAQSGGNNLLCDFTADFDEWAAVARGSGKSLRRNISPRLIETSPPDKIYEVACREVARGRDLPGFIMGTAVIPFGTPVESILAVKRACLDAGNA